MNTAIKRLCSFNSGLYALNWNRLVTKKKWFFIEKTVVEPQTIAYMRIGKYKLPMASGCIVSVFNDQGHRLGEICINNGEITNVAVDISGHLKRVTDTEDAVFKLFKSFVEGKVWKADEFVQVNKMPHK